MPQLKHYKSIATVNVVVDAVATVILKKRLEEKDPNKTDFSLSLSRHWVLIFGNLNLDQGDGIETFHFDRWILHFRSHCLIDEFGEDILQKGFKIVPSKTSSDGFDLEVEPL